MRKNDLLSLLFFFLACLFPGICLLSRLFDYTLQVGSGRLFAGITFLLYGLIGILLLVRKEEEISKVTALPLCLCPLLNQINILLAVHYTDDILVILMLLPWVLLSILVVSEQVDSKRLKLPFYLLTGLLAVPIILVLPFIGFGAKTVLVHEPSPDGLYCAEVIASDEGALGGSTQLTVYREDQSFSLGSFSFRKAQRQIHSGRWGEFESLSWIDGETLSMNDKIYDISSYFREDSSVKSRIFRYVQKNESLLLSCIELKDFTAIEKDAVIREIRLRDKCIDFDCGGEGFGPDTSDWGFYYSERFNMTAMWGNRLSGRMMQKSGNGYLWKESWETPGGDNSYYVEQISEHFFYYELHF